MPTVSYILSSGFYLVALTPWGSAHILNSSASLFQTKPFGSIRASELIFKLPIANVETHETLTDNGDTTWASKKRERERGREKKKAVKASTSTAQHSLILTSVISCVSLSDRASVINYSVSIHQDVWDVGMTGRWQTGLEVSNVGV